MKFMLKYGVLCGEAYAASPRMEGAAIWLPHKHAAADKGPLLRCGAFWIPFSVGLRATIRLQAMDNTTKAMRQKHCTGEYWYLPVLGVDPRHQGKGFGRKLLEPTLARFAREGLPVWLDTASEPNVRFYQRLGFEVCEETVVPGIDVRMWGMLREPGCGMPGT